jgi:aryl-alcohol dehydrogenase-like predicted oxidoreductase
MEKQTLGNHGPQVSRLGLGCMGMSDLYGPADREEGLATLQKGGAGLLLATCWRPVEADG